MIKDQILISPSLKKYISSYRQMDLGVLKVACPYWMNKIKDGFVVLLGKFNGKGESEEIKEVLKRAINESKLNIEITQANVFKIAKRERIGIDCSGLVYRLIDHALKQFDKRLDQVFPGGINKTNARTLTGKKFNLEILNASAIRPLDTIRMMGGKHILLVIENDGKYITYIHSSNRSTKDRGVHLGKIEIINPNDNLDKQKWLEKTPSHENFGQKYFHLEKGDGIRRLKVLAYEN